jgi:hypothetical protein
MDKSAENLAPELMVTDSGYFSKEFNTAIIDGPLRIYFTDRQEANALQIYFDIQESLNRGGMRLDSIPMETPHMFLMLYPNDECFKKSFKNEETAAFGKFGKNLVMGINGPCTDDARKLLCNQVKSIFADALQLSISELSAQ